MDKISGENFDCERALYAANGLKIENCSFKGPADGESPLKESKKIEIKNSLFDLRYPLWHCDGVKMDECEMTAYCRAALWYTKNLVAEGCIFNGIKAIREAKDIKLSKCSAKSEEFCWRSKNVRLTDCTVQSQYPFFECRNLKFTGVKTEGKYSFQYLKDAKFEKCVFDTKDAFWHAKNVTVKDSYIKGEYLGWYSENLTLIDCEIEGTQPLCYCKNLTLVNCRMINCDLSFEYSVVDAEISGEITSVKNPIGGKIIADGFGDIVLSDAVYKGDCKIIKRQPK